MATIHYQLLAEVRVLHEYFLMQPNRRSLLDLPETSAAERQTHLERLTKSVEAGYDLRTVLRIEPTDTTERQLRQLGLIWRATPTGWLVATPARPLPQPDGSRDYEPSTPLPADLALTFRLRPLDASFGNLSAIRLGRRAVPGLFWLTNDPTGKTFDPATEQHPKLTLPVAAFDGQHTYETGELAQLPDGTGSTFVTMARRQTNANTPADWLVAPAFGTKTYLNEADRRLLPKRFTYTFAQPQTDFLAVLRRPDGTEAVRVTYAGPDPTDHADLNFSLLPRLPDQVRAEPLPDGSYTLTLTAGAGPLGNYPVVLSDDHRTDAFALCELRLRTGQPAYDLLTLTDRLRTRRLADGIRTPPARFEVLIKSRLAYWRYRPRQGTFLTLPNPSPLGVFLTTTPGGGLRTRQPYLLSNTQTEFLDSPARVYLPTPRLSPLRTEGGLLEATLTVAGVNDAGSSLIV